MFRAATLPLAALLCASICIAQPQPRQGLRQDPLLVARSASGAAQPLLLDLFLGRPGAEAALVAWLAAHPAADAEHRFGVWLLLCEERSRRMRYREAIEACRAGGAIRPGAADGFLAMIEPLRDVPPMRWNVDRLELTLRRDGPGRHLMIDHPSGPVEALADTGAEISVMSESVARRLGVRDLGPLPSVGTTTEAVSGRIGVVDLSIGGGRLSNVPVLVLPDRQLVLPDGFQLPTILSLGVIMSMGRAAYLDHGARLVLGAAVPDGAGIPVPLYWDPSGVGFEARFAREGRAVHFDTGSSRDYLYPTALRSLSAEEAASRQPYERRIAGIGGERTEQASRLARVTIGVGGHDWVFAPMEMAPTDGEGEAARLGISIVERFETVILDFERMQMFVR